MLKFLFLLQILAIASATFTRVSRPPTLEEAVRNPTTVLAIPDGKSVRVTPNYAASTSTYWMVYAQYSGSTCTSSVASEYGIATGWCLETTTTSSAMYTCTSVNSCFVHVYSDAVCGIEAAGSPYVFNVNVCESTDADDDGLLVGTGTDFASKQVIVTVGFPKLYSGSSGMLSSYSGISCTQSSMYLYQMYYQNRCYSYYDGTDYTSEQFLDPYQYSYDSIACGAGNVVSKQVVPINACQIDSATTSSRVSVTSSGGSSNNTAVIVGAVVGSVGGLCLIAALAYFLLVYKAKSPMDQQADMGSKA